MLYKHISDLTPQEKEQLLTRTSDLMDVQETVASILDEIKSDGDAALRKLTKQFDKAEIETIEVSEDEIKDAMKLVDEDFIDHLRKAADNIRKFHKAQMPDKQWFMEIAPGVMAGQKVIPLNAVGAYVPGGRAAYPSTALMTVIPAKIAGVKNVSVCTPPGPDGKVLPITLAAASIAGADHIYKIGGVQAIGALAYGTESVEAVDKIVGPGNVYVTVAKMLVRNNVEIDFPAGPSEVLIIADETSEASFIAADMIAQAEHDPNAISVLVTTSNSLAENVKQEVKQQVETTPRTEIAKQSLNNAAILIANNMDDCVAFSNAFGPEHLEIMTSDDDKILEKITSAGSIFIGKYSPVSTGDYASGTNHVLPTSGYTRIYSGLNVQHFIKYSTIQKLSEEGLNGLKDTIVTIAEKEGLAAHAEAVKIRFREK
ncbi:histidinol dehydrogenase [Methanohalophilus sp.]|uniref:histidinol dehydrogenase n=1 Tax=Methanohalophilus sp. TaxID=1966352 RepID=UPI00260CFD70|nr:histidinol dehydrogenase [Methanohalophilus sp.]MDK2892118.1 histidinol dehydrogenase [Methanohalophilus sp.]